jgi:Predicted transcriptional regulators
MRSGPIRLGQLGRTIPRVSEKVLTQNLRDLEAAGIVVRADFSDVVLHIEYELKQDAKDSILALLDHLAEWGDAHLNDGHGRVATAVAASRWPARQALRGDPVKRSE